MVAQGERQIQWALEIQSIHHQNKLVNPISIGYVRTCMNLDRLDLNLLRVFAAVQTHGGVTAAAAALHLSQPTVSNALARLRSTLGDELFVRQGVRLQPTPFALRLAPAVRGALGLLTDALADEPPFDPATAKRVFKLAMTDAGQQVFLPRIAAATWAAGRGLGLQAVPISFDSANPQAQAQALADGSVDVVVGPLPPETAAGLDVTPLFTERYVGLVAAPNHAKVAAQGRKRQRLTMADFAKRPIVVVDQAATRHRLVVEQLEALGLGPGIAFRVPHFSAVAPLVAACNGLAVVPSQVAALLAGQAVAGARVRPTELPFEVPPYAISLARHPRFSRDSGLNWLCDLIVEKISSTELAP
jgi:DNA-binding transcriptional LysR family regulator